MFQAIKQWSRERELAKWLKEKRVVLARGYGFEIDGVQVNDLGYLLRHVTDGKLDNFKDLEAIYDNYPLIVGGIVKDMPNPAEVQSNRADMAQATENLKNLRTIVTVIVDYVEKCRKLGFVDRLTWQ